MKVMLIHIQAKGMFCERTLRARTLQIQVLMEVEE